MSPWCSEQLSHQVGPLSNLSDHLYNDEYLDTYMGPIISLAIERRGVQIDSQNIDNTRIMLQFKLPLNEIAVDFYDTLKCISSGYASFDYEESGYEQSDLVKVPSTITLIFSSSQYSITFIFVAQHHSEWRSCRGVEHDCSCKQSSAVRQGNMRPSERNHTAAAVSNRHPGRRRGQDPRSGEHLCVAEGRHR